jgi:glycosyltransferase involved in cell wall biosynthesis
VPDWVREAKHLKFISTVYDLIPIKFSKIFRATEEVEPLVKLIRGIDARDHVICISEHTKTDLCEYRRDLDPSRVSVAYLGASSSFKPCHDEETHQRVRAKYKIPDGPYLLAVSTLAPHKNFDRLIESFGALIHEQRIELNLIISGTSGPKIKQVQAALARWTILVNRIVFIGYAADEDLPGLYGGALAFAFPSIYEGFGLPVLEAMQCGVPVVCSNSSSIPEVAGDAALYFDPLDTEAISSALLNVYRDETLRRSLAEKSLQRATNFNWKRCAEQTIAGYDRALND